MAKYTYVYETGCSPCANVTPLIDTFILFGYDIEKITLNEYAQRTRRGIATPAIIVNSENEEESIVYAEALMNVYVLCQLDPDVLVVNNFSEYLKRILDK